MAEELSFKGDGSDACNGKLRLPPQNIEAEEAILGDFARSRSDHIE